jgi:hypothetical protein
MDKKPTINPINAAARKSPCPIVARNKLKTKIPRAMLKSGITIRSHRAIFGMGFIFSFVGVLDASTI